MSQPLVTAIVSTYGAERFMRGCLTDLVEQTIFKDVEVLVIDSGSPQGESEICSEFMRKHPQIRLLRTIREPLYVTWNRAIQLARGKYFTNANTDDRHIREYDSFELVTPTAPTYACAVINIFLINDLFKINRDIMNSSS